MYIFVLYMFKTIVRCGLLCRIESINIWVFVFVSNVLYVLFNTTQELQFRAYFQLYSTRCIALRKHMTLKSEDWGLVRGQISGFLKTYQPPFSPFAHHPCPSSAGDVFRWLGHHLLILSNKWTLNSQVGGYTLVLVTLFLSEGNTW